MKPMPIEFPVAARGLALQQAARFWRTDIRTIRRWADEAGHGLRDAMVQNGKHASRMAGKKQGPRNKHTKPLTQEPLQRDALAMQFLQCKTRWVCYSSRIYGATKNVYYQIGNRKLSFDELITLAQAHGFQG